MERSAGRLYLCSTPIGNMEDISLRALRVLGEVSCIAAEDTRHTGRLLRHHGIKKPLTSYHDHNEESRAEALIERLLKGDDVALVSDAGTPGLSDPGFPLVKMAIEAGVQVAPIPGPSALTAALVVSGLPPHPFYFGGFLPRKRAQRRRLLESLSTLDATLVFYEVPHRLVSALQEIAALYPRRRAVVARELTKLYEEVTRGTTAEVRDHFESAAPKGECVLLIEGRTATDSGEPRNLSEGDLHAALEAAMDAGKSKKEAIKDVASFLGVDRNLVYQAAIDLAVKSAPDRPDD